MFADLAVWILQFAIYLVLPVWEQEFVQTMSRLIVLSSVLPDFPAMLAAEFASELERVEILRFSLK